MEDNKIFVFLSHSHRDYEKVREVRDLLEREGFRPLMFFLKCLEKEGYEELTKTLIKEEIDSRQRFVLCNSKNANESDWVKYEVDYIKEINRPYEVVDLDWSHKKLEEAIKRFKLRSTVFLSYPNTQSKLADAVYEQLKLHDYRILYDKKDIKSGIPSVQQMVNNVRSAVEKGYVLALLDDNFDIGSWQSREMNLASYYHGRMILVITAPLSAEVILLYGNLNMIDVQGMSIPEASKYIVDCLLRLDISNNQ